MLSFAQEISSVITERQLKLEHHYLIEEFVIFCFVNIFDNTDFVLMLNQASGDREILARKLKISLPQLRYVTNSNEGEGLLFFHL